VLGGDHRDGLGKGQGEAAQLSGKQAGAVRIGVAGPAAKEIQGLLLAENIYGDAHSQVGYRLLVASDQYPGLPHNGDEREQALRISSIIEHKEAAAPIRLQPVTDRLTRLHGVSGPVIKPERHCDGG
jgi:hypothetical protein